MCALPDGHIVTILIRTYSSFMNIVAIGGGEIRERETLAIDQWIVRLTKKRKPRALFVPTASGDAQGYCKTFDRIYGKEIGCKTDHLLLLSNDSDPKQIKKKVLGADIIYVGGGNTLRMMKLWRRLGVDRSICRAGEQGTVLAGLSAGAICWHQWGHSDSSSFSGQSEWAYMRVKGLGLARGMFCPHLDEERRHKPFADMIQRRGGLGIACDNNAAVWYREGKSPVVKCSQKGAMVRVYRRKNKKVMVEVFEDGEELRIGNQAF
jgi:dipeptidase E